MLDEGRIMIKDKCKVISVFSCLGKTYVGNNYDNILDLEASDYKWIYNDKKLAKNVEKRKGVTDRILNPEYPGNYLKVIHSNLDKYDVILITPEKMIRDILRQREIDYFVLYPQNPEFVMKRAIKRGNNMHFANSLKTSYLKWYPSESENVLILKEDEYLEDILKKNKFI